VFYETFNLVVYCHRFEKNKLIRTAHSAFTQNDMDTQKMTSHPAQTTQNCRHRNTMQSQKQFL